MEEILQSIRKIIAEDGDEAAKPAAADGGGEVAGSDVLELTETMKEDAPAPTAAAPAAAPPAAPGGGDVLNTIDEALAAPAAQPAAPAAAAQPAAQPAPQPSATNEGLAAPETIAAASAALDKLKTAEPPLPPVQTTPSPAFRSGNTVEDMVAEMLKPMIKEWLDANLPAIVERLVEREIRRLAR